MKREELNTLIDRVTSGKGILRTTGYWLRRVLANAIDYLEGFATKEAAAVKTVIDSSMSDESANPAENRVVKAYIDSKAAIPIVTKTGGGYWGLQPNKFYVCDTAISKLNVADLSGDAGVVLNYFFEFTTSSGGCTFTYPTYWKWANGAAPEIEANTTYQVSVIRDCAVITPFYK